MEINTLTHYKYSDAIVLAGSLLNPRY